MFLYKVAFVVLRLQIEKGCNYPETANNDISRVEGGASIDGDKCPCYCQATSDPCLSKSRPGTEKGWVQLELMNAFSETNGTGIVNTTFCLLHFQVEKCEKKETPKKRILKH